MRRESYLALLLERPAVHERLLRAQQTCMRQPPHTAGRCPMAAPKHNAGMTYTATFTPETLSRADVDAHRGPLVLEFGTNWCGHCQGAQPSVQSVMANSAVPLVKVEDGPGRPLGRTFRVKLWPTLVFLKDGQEVAREVRPTGTDALSEALALLA